MSNGVGNLPSLLAAADGALSRQGERAKLRRIRPTLSALGSAARRSLARGRFSVDLATQEGQQTRLALEQNEPVDQALLDRRDVRLITVNAR